MFSLVLIQVFCFFPNVKAHSKIVSPFIFPDCVRILNNYSLNFWILQITIFKTIVDPSYLKKGESQALGVLCSRMINNSYRFCGLSFIATLTPSDAQILVHRTWIPWSVSVLAITSRIFSLLIMKIPNFHIHCYRDTLMSIAKHYENGESLPEDMYLKLLAARTFRAGTHSLSQVSKTSPLSILIWERKYLASGDGSKIAIWKLINENKWQKNYLHHYE